MFRLFVGTTSGFNAEQHNPERLEAGRIHPCRIESGTTLLFDSEIKICHAEEQKSTTKIGERFIGLTEHEKNRLFKLLMDIERNNIRRKTS